MTVDQITQSLSENGLMPCWRHDDTSGIIDATKALADVGFNNVELTMTMPGTLQLIERACAEVPQVIVGVGTVLDADTARLAILAGAKYVVCPILIPEVITLCHRYNVVAIPGVSSPSEIVAAHSCGAHLMKIFPAGSGLINHIRLAEIHSVFPGVRTVVTGGAITLSDITGFMSAGASSMVVGMPTMAMEAYTARRWTDMQKIATRLLRMVRDGRDPAARQRLGQTILRRYTDLEGQAQTASATAR